MLRKAAGRQRRLQHPFSANHLRSRSRFRRKSWAAASPGAKEQPACCCSFALSCCSCENNPGVAKLALPRKRLPPQRHIVRGGYRRWRAASRPSELGRSINYGGPQSVHHPAGNGFAHFTQVICGHGEGHMKTVGRTQSNDQGFRFVLRSISHSATG